MRVAVVGKYVHLTDTYKSLNEALAHGGIANEAKVELRYLDSEDVDAHLGQAQLAGVHAILIPRGFGARGTEGKIEAIRYAREHDVPFFGICLGLQLAVVEYLRHVGGFTEAHSTELDGGTRHPVVSLLD